MGLNNYLINVGSVKNMKCREITMVAGPCATESEEQVMTTAHSIAEIRDVARDYRIQFKLRGGAWKPRTAYKGSDGERIFEGTGETGLKWLSQAAETYSLPIVSEIMSEMDLRHFLRYLKPERDYLQVGARDAQTYALLYAVGGTTFNVLLKNSQHGIDTSETIGSLQRFEKNSSKVFCVRGQKPYIPVRPDDEGHKNYMAELLQSEDQHPDARNLNNIAVISQLREEPFFDSISLCYDPSHAIGGKNDLMRRRIGEYAIKAIKQFGYDWIMVECDDRSAVAKCDGPQALLTTLNGVDWSQTNAGKEPEIKPLTVVDIAWELMVSQAQLMGMNPDGNKMKADRQKLDKIRWGMTP